MHTLASSSSRCLLAPRVLGRAYTVLTAPVEPSTSTAPAPAATKQPSPEHGKSKRPHKIRAKQPESSSTPEPTQTALDFSAARRRLERHEREEAVVRPPTPSIAKPLHLRSSESHSPDILKQTLMSRTHAEKTPKGWLSHSNGRKQHGGGPIRRPVVLPRAPDPEPVEKPERKSVDNKPAAFKPIPVDSLDILGPGFEVDTWGEPLAPPKVLPPHLVPSERLVEGTIGNVESLLTDVAPVSEHQPVATLAHGLERVLFNPGVHWLQDPRSYVYNFTPWLEKIPKVSDFAFEKLTGFVSSSRDDDLRELAKREGKKFVGSTSSLSGMMSHIYFLLSEHKEVEITTMSQHFTLEKPRFTAGQRMPSSVILHYKDGVYATDSDSDADSDKNVLTWLGTLLENFLTKTPAEFNKFIRVVGSEPGKEEPDSEGVKPMREAYRFAKSDKFVMRSQLDCHDSRLPGTGVFDIKTRAALPIRMDVLNFEENSGYVIKTQHGYLESFEREYFDLIRSAFLKYSVQVRIGNMDGVMVAYHNTDRIFGFQYISLEEMDQQIYGPYEGIGNKVFNKSIQLMEAVLEEASRIYPNQSISCTFETRYPGKVMDVFVQPAEWTGEGQKPIAQLLVQVEHKLNGAPAKAFEVLKAEKAEWTMTYNIRRVILEEDALRRNLKGAETRKERQFVLPESVSLKDAQKYWETLSYNPKITLDVKAFKKSAFTLADEGIQMYRTLAKEGRRYSEAKELERAGLPKVVLGHGVYTEEEEDLKVGKEQK